MYETMEVHPASWIFYLSFIFLSAFVFLNMMIGVIIDSLNEEHKAKADSEADEAAKQLKTIDLRLQNIEARLQGMARANNNKAP